MPTPKSADLRLVAFDLEDLAVVSAHLQDAVLQVADMAYLPKARRFAALLNRFDWAAAVASGATPADSIRRRHKPYVRRRTALRFERVTGAKLAGIDRGKPRGVLELLAIQFEETSPPAGRVTLVFAGGGAVRLEVECLEAEMQDLGAAWATRRKPAHADAGPESDG